MEATDPTQGTETTGESGFLVDEDISDPLGAPPLACASPSSPPPPVPAPDQSPPNPTWIALIKQDGEVFPIPDLATLQKWVVQGRVLSGDLYSHDGIRWDIVGLQPELQPFFSLVEQARKTGPSEAPRVRPPTSPEEGWSGVDEPSWDEPFAPPAPEFEPAILENCEPDDARGAGEPFRAGEASEAPAVNLAYKTSPPNRAPAEERPAAPPPQPTLAEVTRPALELRPGGSNAPLDRPRRPQANPAARSRSALVTGLVVAVSLVLLVAAGLHYWPMRPGVDGLARTSPQPMQAASESTSEAPLLAAPKSATPSPPPDPQTMHLGRALTSTASSPTEPRVSPAVRMGAGGSSSKATSTVSGSGTNRALVKRGWEAVEQKDYGKARQSFVDAAALNPTDGWAWYGLGYASEKQGDTRTAQNAYCKAKNVAGSNLDLTREVEGRITNGRFVCP